jgi:hypothetical protein
MMKSWLVKRLSPALFLGAQSINDTHVPPAKTLFSADFRCFANLDTTAWQNRLCLNVKSLEQTWKEKLLRNGRALATKARTHWNI